jgi:hypothetical protein
LSVAPSTISYQPNVHPLPLPPTVSSSSTRLCCLIPDAHKTEMQVQVGTRECLMSAFPRYFLRVGGAGVVVSEMLISTDLGGVEGAGDGASSRGAGSSRGLIQHGPTFGASAVSQWQHLVDPCGREMKMSIVRSSDSAVLSKILMCMPNRSRGDFALRGAPWQCSQLTVFRDDCREGLVRHLARATAGKKRRERRGFSKSRSPDELENHAVTARRQSGSWGAVGQYSLRTEQLHTSERQAGEESILTRSPPLSPTPHPHPPELAVYEPDVQR